MQSVLLTYSLLLLYLYITSRSSKPDLAIISGESALDQSAVQVIEPCDDLPEWLESACGDDLALELGVDLTNQNPTEKQELTPILVEIRGNHGRMYPACERARELCDLLGTKTITEDKANALLDVGYEVKVATKAEIAGVA